MLHKILQPGIIFLTCCISLPSVAQDSTATQQPKIWDLQTCLRYAKENNIQINTLKLNRRISEQELLLSKAAIYPNLSASASQNFNHGHDQGISTSGSYGLSSSWTLYNGGYLRTDIRQNHLEVESANLSILEEENDITLQITQAYLNILMDKESIVYSEDLVKTSEAQLQQATRLFNAGSLARKDVAQFQAQLASDQYTLISSQNAWRQDILTLKQILQLPFETSFDIVKPDTVITEVVILPLDTVKRYALQHRPEVKNSELGVQIAELNLDKAKSGYKPSLTASAGVGTSYANNPTYSASVGQFNNNFYQQIGITLAVPIFTRRLNKTNVEEAKIGIDQAQLDLKDTRTSLSLAVEQAYINAVNARGQYDAAARQLQYTREVYRIATEELRLGAVNIVDFYQQRNLYVQALQSYLQAKYNAALSVSIYDFYSGIPVKL